jgi:hypothetical protein
LPAVDLKIATAGKPDCYRSVWVMGFLACRPASTLCSHECFIFIPGR